MQDVELEQVKIGAVVTLNSGGPRMTVTGWQDDSAPDGGLQPELNQRKTLMEIDADEISIFTCWMNERDELQQGSFPASCLRIGRTA